MRKINALGQQDPNHVDTDELARVLSRKSRASTIDSLGKLHRSLRPLLGRALTPNDPEYLSYETFLAEFNKNLHLLLTGYGCESSLKNGDQVLELLRLPADEFASWLDKRARLPNLPR